MVIILRAIKFMSLCEKDNKTKTHGFVYQLTSVMPIERLD